MSHTPKYRPWLYRHRLGLLIYLFAPWLASRWHEENCRYRDETRDVVVLAEMIVALETLRVRAEETER